MSGKICPIFSASVPGALQKCIGDECMLFSQSSSEGKCGLVKEPERTNRKMDILSAQIQEIQVAMNELVNDRLSK